MFIYDNYMADSLIITKYINKPYQHKNICLLLTAGFQKRVIIETHFEHIRLFFLDQQSSDQNFSSRGNDQQSSE